MTGYVPPTYEFFTFHIYFCTQTHIHIQISPQQVTTPNTKSQNIESSPQSSLPCGQQTLQTHHLKIHLHSHLYIRNHNHVPPHKCITHHQNPINHKTYNIHLLRPMLTHLPSLPFQMKKQNMYPSQQMVVK